MAYESGKHYKFSCGCIHTNDTVHRVCYTSIVDGKKTYTHKYKCRQHPDAIIIEAFKYCRNCEQTFEVVKDKRDAYLFCPDCRINKPTTDYSILISLNQQPRKHNCKNYDWCLWNLPEKEFVCTDCEKYEKAPLKISGDIHSRADYIYDSAHSIKR